MHWGKELHINKKRTEITQTKQKYQDIYSKMYCYSCL